MKLEKSEARAVRRVLEELSIDFKRRHFATSCSILAIFCFVVAGLPPFPIDFYWRLTFFGFSMALLVVFSWQWKKAERAKSAPKDTAKDGAQKQDDRERLRMVR